MPDITDIASEAAGNWREFGSFAWHDEPDDADAWCIVYTRNRDSSLLANSNHDTIEKELRPLLDADDPDIRSERHSHWAWGWTEGYAIRVYRGEEVTDAFRKWVELRAAIEDCTILDSEDHSRREREATLENIAWEGGSLANDAAPDDWAEHVWRWLWDNDQTALESADDQGAYPDRKQIGPALEALCWLEEEDED
jgi:hypothetical protein